MSTRSAIILVGAGLLASLPAFAQMRDNTEKQLDCNGNRGGRDARSCEMREQGMAVSPSLSIDAGANGGIQVKGWSKPQVLVRAKVEAWADDDTRAKTIAGQVKVVTQSGRIHAEGPSGLRREGWVVSLEVFAPHKTGVTARAHNGGISFSDLDGVIDALTTNGGIHINRLAGKVNGVTTNGGVSVELAGDRWSGDSLDVRTTNGGVQVQMPDGYNAQLEASTTNGGMHLGFPITVTGEIGKRVSTRIGNGGALLRFTTTNGGIRIGKSGAPAAKRKERTV